MSNHLKVINKMLLNRTIFTSQLLFSLILKSLNMYMFILVLTSITDVNTLTPNNGYNYNELITYVILSRVIASLYSMDTMINIAIGIRSGSIVFDFLKPINYVKLKLYECIGTNVIYNIFLSIILLIVGSVITHGYKIIVVNLGVYILVSFMIIFGFLTMFCVDFLLGLLAFYTKGFYGIRSLKQSIFLIFSGAVIPISFYPDSFKEFVTLFPFQTMISGPCNLVMGMLSLREATLLFCVQLLWFIGFAMLVLTFYTKAKKRLEVSGG